MVTGVIATPWTALIATHEELTGGATVTEQLTVLEFPFLSLTVTE
jgi:hypothetical protein